MASKLPRLPIDSHAISSAFKHINNLISEMLDKISIIYQNIGIRYYVKPNYEMLVKILVPQEFKPFIDLPDVFCMFENRNQLFREQSIWQNDGKQIKRFENLSFSRKAKTNYDKLPESNQYNKNSFEKKTDSIIEIPTYKKHSSSNLSEKFITPTERAEEEIISYIEKRTFDGFTMTREDLKRIAQEKAETHNVSLGQRWFRKFVKKYSSTMKLLTHGNSINRKKQISKSNNIKQTILIQDDGTNKIEEGVFESYDEYPVFEDDSDEDIEWNEDNEANDQKLVQNKENWCKEEQKEE